MTTTPPPTRPPEGRPTADFWRSLLDSIYQIWQRLNRTQLTIGESTIYTGAGSPENNQIGSVGDLWLRTDGGSNTTLYVKESGDDTDTGWIAK